MTDEDQNAAIGRMVTRFSEAKRRRAALLADAQNAANRLSSAASILRELDTAVAFHDGSKTHRTRVDRSDVTILTLPESAQVNKLIDELRSVSAELRTLRQNMKDAGLGVE